MGTPDKCRHFAIIPARKGSTGFPHKNRYLFNYTADFVDASGLFDGVMVTSDDELILGWAEKLGYHAHHRPASLATETARIKDAIVDLVDNTTMLDGDDYLWLIYPTMIHRSVSDFRGAFASLRENEPKAFCTFIDVETHPYITWYQDGETGKMRQYVPNDVPNRQEMPTAWRNFHYIIGFKVCVLPELNSNLMSEDTYPIFLTPEQQVPLCDVDEPEDLLAWKRKHPGDFERWLRSLPADLDVSPIAEILKSANRNNRSITDGSSL